VIASSDYERIVADITARIRAGQLQPGDPLPTGVQLRRDYGCSGTVVREAMLVLRTAGLVRGGRGGRVYVAERPPVAGEGQVDLTQELVQVHREGWRDLVAAVEQGFRAVVEQMRKHGP
jgi:DNA-binding FadR family transcriptional regulator